MAESTSDAGVEVPPEPTRKEIDYQVQRLCSAFQGDQRPELLKFLVRFYRQKRWAKRTPTAADVMREFFDSRQEPFTKEKARKAAEKLRASTREYYSENPNDPVVIHIPKGTYGGYRPTFAPRGSEAFRDTTSEYAIADAPAAVRTGRADESLTARFWEPHLASGRSALIVYGRPLFVKSSESGSHDFRYTRRLSVNRRNQLPKLEPGEQTDYRYVPVDDVKAALSLTAWFERRGVETLAFGARPHTPLATIVSATKYQRCSCLVVGGPRYHGIFRGYQDEPLRQRRKDEPERRLPYRIESHADGDRVVRRDTDGGQTVEFASGAMGTPPRVPVVVTRREGLRHGDVTMIVANSGLALDRVCTMLLHENDLRDLFKDPRLVAWKSNVPHEFQLVLSVTVRRFGTVAAEVEIVAVWSDEPTS